MESETEKIKSPTAVRRSQKLLFTLLKLERFCVAVETF